MSTFWWLVVVPGWAAGVPVADGGGVGDFPNAALAFNVTPTGNGFPTMSTLSVQVRMVELDMDINEQWSAVSCDAGIQRHPHRQRSYRIRLTIARPFLLCLLCAACSPPRPRCKGATNQSHSREFLVNLGLVSDDGASAASTPFRDKVAL